MPRMDTSTIRLAIAIPTYNEVANLPELIQRIKNVTTKANMPCTVLVVDDNSPDGTGNIAEALAQTETTPAFAMQVLHRQGKLGLGKAYLAGFEELLQQNYTHILQMDADLSHDPSYITAFIGKAKNFDLVVGSRYIKGGATPDWGIMRKFLSSCGNLYASTLLGTTIHDYTGGFNLYSVALLNRLDITSLKANGYDFLVELKYRALQQTSKIDEIPIVFIDRAHGNSKIPKNTILKSFIAVLRLRFFR